MKYDDVCSWTRCQRWTSRWFCSSRSWLKPRLPGSIWSATGGKIGRKIGAKLVTQWKNVVGVWLALTEILCKFSSFISIIYIQEFDLSQATTWEWFEGEREQHLNRPVQVHDSQVTLCWHREDWRFVLPPGWTFHSTSDAVSLPSGSLAGGRIWFSSSDRSSYSEAVLGPATFWDLNDFLPSFWDHSGQSVAPELLQ